MLLDYHLEGALLLAKLLLLYTGMQEAAMAGLQSSARVRDYYKEWGMKQLNFMLKFAFLWSVFATCNAMFSVCKIWFIIPDAFSSGCCYQTGSLPHCNDVWAREEATDGIEFCYKHQISFYESNLLRFRCCWRSEDLRDRCQWC